MPIETSRASLRARLRQATDHLHVRLDKSFEPEQLTEARIYGDFLACQLAARAPIEAWAKTNCPPDLRPPEVTSLLIEDLLDLGRPFSQRHVRFSLSSGADPLGLAWTIAGSSLGNRALLGQLDPARSDLPLRFLSDGATWAFWQQMLPRLETEYSLEKAQPAIRAAIDTFIHFTRAFDHGSRQAAA